MKSCTKILIGLFMIICPVYLFAESTTGEIVFLEGIIDISRQGEFMNYYDVDYGLIIEEEDIISTGADGYLEIELNAPNAGTVIKVEPDTTFYFSTAGTQTDMRLLSGSLALKVGKLATGENLNVQTESAVMGVRGTEFTVNIGADTELLITCVEGKVSCASSTRETFAEPGTVSTWSQTSDLMEDGVAPSEIDAYTQKWQEMRIEALMINGLKSSEYYSRQLSTYQPRMEQAMESLASSESLLMAYAEKMNQEESIPRSQAARDKIALSRGIMSIRSNLVMYEQILFTLKALSKYHNQGIGKGRFSDGTNSTQYYRLFDRAIKSNMEMIAKAHYYLRIYTYIDYYAGANDAFGTDNSNLNDFLNKSPF